MKHARGVLRAGMPIKTSVGHYGGIPDLHDADAIDATLAKEARRSGQDTCINRTDTDKGAAGFTFSRGLGQEQPPRGLLQLG